jgi:hypothetical protein
MHLATKYARRIRLSSRRVVSLFALDKHIVPIYNAFIGKYIVPIYKGTEKYNDR